MPKIEGRRFRSPEHGLDTLNAAAFKGTGGGRWVASWRVEAALDCILR